MNQKAAILLTLLFIGKIMLAQQPDLTQLEYYFDSDPGFGNGTQVSFTPDSIIDVSFNADLSLIDVGYHKLFVRTKDENRKWSLIYKQGIYKSLAPSTNVLLPDIVEIEYFFDNDPGYGNGTGFQITTDSLINQDFKADMSMLTVGSHQFYMRVKDENKKWSLIYTEEIEKVLPNQWEGTVDFDWNNASNWSGNNVPTSIDIVVILNVLKLPVISGITGECYSLEIQSGANLTIENNGILDVMGN